MCDKIETYGDPHLHPGYYPIMSQNDNGGCNTNLIETYGDPHLHHDCYPQQRFTTMCNRDRAPGQVAVAPCAQPLEASPSNHGLVETYGDPHLHPGVYEDSSVFNKDCMMEPRMGPANCDEIARVAERTIHMEQRAGNNPFVFEEVPKYAQPGFVVGTGCMNAECHCKNCHGDCMCQAHQPRLLSKVHDNVTNIINMVLALVPHVTGHRLVDIIITLFVIMVLYKKLRK